LDQFLSDLAKNPQIRYGRIGESIEAALLEALAEDGYFPNGRVEWAKLTGDDLPRKTMKRKKRKSSMLATEIQGFFCNK
jgi:hypothetical protein